ncbi:universal stress protein [Hymenobacter psychrophilus]|uniref:Nucleotide-binding universal stress protein, UspA family n=1 Tax=Hymenobacter psychrophilus TaxID=651662 RepID=A0A1H3K5U7_9BACT|nr:universal stress protein [Hymenobacter psychrophilus]SDY47582.1 Nucleotide-binding universal stress protein, UspA family [Hymenobacter psychrophilus]
MPASLLVLTDFFREANGALDYATTLASTLQARLVLLHVRRDSVLDPEMFTGELSNLSKESIALAMSSIALDLPVPVVAEVGHGRVASAVADAVTRHHPALVVLGRSNYDDIPDNLIQTTALELLRLVAYPLLVVPHTVSGLRPLRRVLFAVDGEPFSLGEHAGAVRQLLTAIDAEVTVLYVAPNAVQAEAEEATDQALDTVLRTGLTIDLPLVKARTLADASPARAILDVAQSTDFDLVVVVARPRSFFGNLFHRSITAEILRRSTIPVLVLPAA